jgi:hypothetical protein
MYNRSYNIIVPSLMNYWREKLRLLAKSLGSGAISTISNFSDYLQRFLL